ncbi:MAG TPA: hypothetical protein VGU74_15590 [Gemmatimonadales bacterium]|nr:hypothetical protein [Gemmatimonadales bacterium]
MHVIYDWPIWIPVLTILLLSLGAGELGFRYGRSRPLSESERDIVSTLRTSTLGLVALLLGFSFAITSSRHNDRSRLAMDEANAIGTCYLRAGLVAEPASSQMRAALRRYTDLRIESFERGLDPQEFERLAADMHAALDDLWTGVAHTVSADRQLALAAAIVPAANDVIDLSATREWMRRYHMPPSVVWLLALSIILCGAMTGHALGEAGQRHVGIALGLNLLILMVAFVVLDFDRPRRGLIRVDQTPLIQLRESMKAS